MITNEDLKNWFFSDTKHRKKELTRIFDVEYVHLVLGNKDDIYVTKYGIADIEILLPQNHFGDEKWFNKNSERLSGTSSVYRVQTKKIKGESRDLVIKWNRMGQDIPGWKETEDLMYAVFNSPFEEFALVTELREEIHKSDCRVELQKPLAIYVPSEKVDFWKTGRKEFEMDALVKAHKEVALDMHRSYAVIYEWIPGMDLGEALGKKVVNKAFVKKLSEDTHKKIISLGYIVKDGKADHIIIKPNKNGGCAKLNNGEYKCGMVDFELLSRVPEHEQVVRKRKRQEYLRRQKERFTIQLPDKFHPHLMHTNIMGVDYIYGQVESTKGRLWVVGKDPYLFDYFLPERWEEERKSRISSRHNIYYTVTKDDIHLVWRYSYVGFVPDMDPFKEEEKKILDHGYNSPFEEFFIAVELDRMGIPAIYPRAIYMTGKEVEIPEDIYDASRFRSHKFFRTPDGKPVLQKNREYIKIWGFWNGPDDMLASKDGDYYKGINALRAYRRKIITKNQYFNLMKRAKEQLGAVGIEDLYLRGTHLLMSMDSKGKLVKDKEGNIEIRYSNFAFLKVK